MLRTMGRDLERRARIWKDPHLYIWGWQSPLHFYGRMDSPTRHFFVDNLLRDQADRDHPLIRPRTDEIIATLKRRPPELIFTAYPPFKELRAFLLENYLPSRMALGLWVRQQDYGRFERAGALPATGGETGTQTSGEDVERLGHARRPGARPRRSSREGHLADQLRAAALTARQPDAASGSKAPSSSTDCARSLQWSTRRICTRSSQSERLK